MDEKHLKALLFPYSRIRKSQEDLVDDVRDAIKNKTCLIAHAPTGLGKTVATLSPALAETISKKDLTIFFLTSRHTQHSIVIKTLKQIREKYRLNFGAVSIIGKKWMCAQPDTNFLYTKEFVSFCKALRDDDKCEFYSNLGSRSKPSVECEKAIRQITAVSPVETKRIMSICSKEKVCPYEMSLLLAAKSKVIVTDYYYLIDPFIREIFMKRIGKNLEDSIIIFDEAHNLPARTRDLMTAKISTFILGNAIKEAKKYRFEESELYLSEMNSILEKLSKKMNPGNEKMIEKDVFVRMVEKIKDYDEISAALEFAADEVRENERSSYIGSVVMFMDLWRGPDKGYARILSKKSTRYGDMVTIAYRCLDPSLFTKDIIAKSYSTILMSGTLTPTSMYNDLLGFPENTKQKMYTSPFPQKNRHVLIVPKTTTKFTMRSEDQYKEIGKTCSEMIEKIPGNTAVFFPSYFLRDKIIGHIKTEREIFIEEPKMDKEKKQRLLEEFKKTRREAVLLGATSGSFGEGVDIPNNILKGVIVVGLPLDRPSLETKELISYYDEKFGKGWDYGYIMPAITRALQNAGRCIRSEKDKGVMIFLDKRYSWPRYIKCFPEDWDLKITVDYNKEIEDFFQNTK
jgi:DNA excision repair protein ERCC-2